MCAECRRQANGTPFLMDRKEKLILLKNATSNVARGSAGALVAIVLPPFLTRLMAASAFSTWCLILQLSAYVGYLDFGIQTAVGRFVAHANEKGDTERRDRMASTSLAALGLAAVLGICGSGVAAVLLPHIFRQMPVMLIGGAQIAFLLVASSLAFGLPASVFNGIFVGYQRNEVSAVIIGGSRICTAVLLVLVVARGGGLAEMGAVVALVNLSSYGFQYLMYRRVAPDVRLSAQCVSVLAARELVDYCLSLSVWSFGMLLVTGLDVILVGYFQFDAVAPYAVAASLITFLGGLQNAVFSAMVPSIAVLHARGNSAELGRTMITATRYGTFLLLLTGLPLVLFGDKILRLWVGPGYAARGAHILEMLALANMIRLSLTPYAVTLIGTGQQRLITFIPLLEGFSNLMLSILFGYLWGAVGVVIGTLGGALVVFAGNLYYNMPRTTDIKFQIPEYLRDGFLRPLVCAMPCLLLACARRALPDSPIFISFCIVLTLVLTLGCFWRWGLVRSERNRLRPHLAFEGTNGA
jgi:O-antigen/teichoic acid export membrane protein